jgi:hypothetical protein
MIRLKKKKVVIDDEETFQKLMMLNFTKQCFTDNYEVEEKKIEDNIEVFKYDDDDDDECNVEFNGVGNQVIICEPLCSNDLNDKTILEWLEYSCIKDTKQEFFAKLFRFSLIYFSANSKSILSSSIDFKLFKKCVDCFHFINNHKNNEEHNVELQQDFLKIFIGKKDLEEIDYDNKIYDIKKYLEGYPLLQQYAFICFPSCTTIQELLCKIEKEIKLEKEKSEKEKLEKEKSGK